MPPTPVFALDVRDCGGFALIMLKLSFWPAIKKTGRQERQAKKKYGRQKKQNARRNDKERGMMK